jgi:GNAT superfamily N-acetyltransferase
VSRLRLAPCVDLAVYYAADAVRYDTPGCDTLMHVTPAVFAARYRDCPSIGFEYDGQPIGGILFDGETAHIAVLPAWRGRWALLLRPALDWLFDLQPEILAEVEADNPAGLEFMHRNGWPAIGRRGPWIVHRMTKQPRRPAATSPAPEHGSLAPAPAAHLS